MVGACIGFVGIIGVRVLVLGDSFDGLHSKFAETGMLETVGVSLLAILILLFSIFLQVLLHEGGHLVCGLATGYRFVSFRIFNLTFIRKDGKLCIKRFSLAGTGGQCLLTPPERPLEDIPTTLYNLGGVFHLDPIPPLSHLPPSHGILSRLTGYPSSPSHLQPYLHTERREIIIRFSLAGTGGQSCLPHPKGLLKISQPPCTTWVECLPTC